MAKQSLHIAKNFVSLIFIAIGIVAVGLFYYVQFELPDTESLKTVQLQVPLQIFTQDGKLIATLGEKRRIPIPYEQIPKPLIDAVLATEDQRYFQHPGVDFPGLIRAAIQLVITGRKEQGGSTITMQVARSFYLTRHKTFGRKIREILLALKIENTLSKEKILELYLNKIFFGNRAYGVAAAAEVYYGKRIDQLSIDQYAMIAGIPKAPSVLNPLANQDAAIKRRNHVLMRMFELHYIDEKTYKTAIDIPLGASYHDLQVQLQAPYVAELAREQVAKMYGDDIYTDGYKVYTTIDSNLQNRANQAVYQGLLAYDQRHGYRGPEKNWGMPDIKHMDHWEDLLRDIPAVNGLEPAVVMDVSAQSITALRANGSLVTIPWEGLVWARRQTDTDDEDNLGPVPQTADAVAHVGDVIRLSPVADGFRLAQIPKAESSLVVMNPKTGGIMALVGGFDYQRSKFNRATNAERQPGSSFKPFIYSAALDKGYTLASLINDAPMVLEDPRDGTLWRPQNDTHRFYGPTRLHTAIVHSRNLVSIRLLDQIGVTYAIKYAQNFGFARYQLPHALSLALGTASVTPLQLTAGYSVFANGGFRVVPYILNRIQNTRGELIYQAKPLIVCETCVDKRLENKMQQSLYAPRVISAETAFLMTSVLRDVIQHGTASPARRLGRGDLAGKTGTTNNQYDAWFVGYNQDMVAAAWVGFDQPESLYEHGNKAALPIWMNFMQVALKNFPEQTWEQPAGIVSVRIDPSTGKRASASSRSTLFEYFTEESVPKTENAGFSASDESSSGGDAVKKESTTDIY